MSSILEQLQDDESVLLMYLADELAGEDRAEAERRLATNPPLQDQLHRLRDTHEAVMGSLGRLDAVMPLPTDESAAVRNAAAAIRRWQAHSAPAPGLESKANESNRWRIWAVPSAAAAAIVLLVLGVSIYKHPQKDRAIATLALNPIVPPAVVPTTPGIAGSAAGVPSSAAPSADDDDLPLFAINTRDLIETESVEELTASVGSVLDRDLGRDGRGDGGSREDSGDTKPIFDIPLDVGQ